MRGETGSNFDRSDGPPKYQAHASSSFNGAHSNFASTAGRSNDSSSQDDPRAAEALQLQRQCREAVKRVKSNSLLAKSDWAQPLTSAPVAISVMAFLLKTAADRRVADLEVNSLEVKNEKNDKVIGTLPSKFFHTNLQHCSNIGQLAFLDAQVRMNKIKGIAETMFQGGDNIRYIIELLEDPDDAKYNLKPAIDEIRCSATECREQCVAIKDKFDYWYRVVDHLTLTAWQHRGETLQMQEEVKKSHNEAETDANTSVTDAQDASLKIGLMERELETTQEQVDRAQAEVDRLRLLPADPEPGYYDDARMAQSLDPMTAAPTRVRGVVSDAWAWAWGSRSRHSEDQRDAEEHRAKVRARQNELIAQARKRREAERARAEAVLAAARAEESSLLEKMERARSDIAKNEHRLADAKNRLTKANLDMTRLADENLGLEQIIEILRESAQQLGKLKEQIQPLVAFFSDLETDVSVKIVKHVDSFLGIIERNMRPGEGPGVEQELRLRDPSKKQVQQAAMQIQGRFSVIADVASAYVQISDRCIRPAINKMQFLAGVKDDDWVSECAKFNGWCDAKIVDIDQIAQMTTRDMGKNMLRRVNMIAPAPSGDTEDDA